MILIIISSYQHWLFLFSTFSTKTVPLSGSSSSAVCQATGVRGLSHHLVALLVCLLLVFSPSIVVSSVVGLRRVEFCLVVLMRFVVSVLAKLVVDS